MLRPPPCGTLTSVPTIGNPTLQPYELFIGLRYTRAKRRNHFISFISLISMLGMGLGVMALIVVLSVMNGFQKEIRARSTRRCPPPRRMSPGKACCRSARACRV